MDNSLFILGGSSIYIPQLLVAMEKSDLLKNFKKITLFGRDLSKLEYISQFGQSLAKKQNLSTIVDYTSNFDVCLNDEYNIIFNQIRFGGMEARNNDEQIAIKNNFVADETLGIVGIPNAIRSIIMLTPYLETLQKKKNDYTFINFTNPASIITQYITSTFHKNTLGICDYPQVFKNKIADFLQYKRDEINIKYFGLNHFAVVYDVLKNDKSIYNDFKSKIDDFQHKLSIQKHFDYTFVIPSWEYIFYKETCNKKQQEKEKNRAAVLLDIEKEFSEYISKKPPIEFPPMLKKRNCEWYEVGIIPLFQFYFNKDSKKEMVVNVDYKEDIFNLGIKNTIVETNANYKNGILEPTKINESLKNSLQFQYLSLMKKVEITLLDGILKRDFNKIIEASLCNPMVQSAEGIYRFFSEVLEKDSFFYSNFPNLKNTKFFI